jgi:hypothetical protein
MPATSTKAIVRTAVLGAAAATLVACGGSAGTPETGRPPAAASAPASAPGTATAPAAVAGRVSANDATKAEIVAALRGAGVPGAERWADEVIEYRPYPADDPQLTRLRANLDKYEPAPGVIDAIVAVLRP